MKMNEKVADCMMQDCAFNRNKMCHARSITVGDSDHPRCDTFIRWNNKGGAEDVIGNVGACKVVECSFNDSLECTSDSIRVGAHGKHPDCNTFITQSRSEK